MLSDVVHLSKLQGIFSPAIWPPDYPSRIGRKYQNMPREWLSLKATILSEDTDKNS